MNVTLKKAESWSVAGPSEWMMMYSPPVVSVKCPNGHIAGLSDHEVGSDGVVTPSLICPTDGCDWHVHATLEDWHDY